VPVFVLTIHEITRNHQNLREEKMFLVTKPSADRIQRFIESQRDLPFSYAEVGATRGNVPNGYTVDHNRLRLGDGLDTLSRAVAALSQWGQFDLGWVQIVPAGTPLAVGEVVVVRTKHFGFWSLNACRVIYLVDEQTPVRKFGFGYGTLPGHAESGEERFTIEWHESDNSVWYEILAFSRPGNVLVKLGLPLARMLQQRFVRDSKKRMLEWVGPGGN
jgi:uncharacterized protein (UPF0548 family)